MIKIETRIFADERAARRHAAVVEVRGGRTLVLQAAHLAVWDASNLGNSHAEAYVNPPNLLWVIVTCEDTD